MKGGLKYRVARCNYPRQPEEWYLDPVWCTELLLERETFGPLVWDPACGRGAIPDVLAAAGYEVGASDLVDRGYRGLSFIHDFLAGALVDFEPARRLIGRADIVTNPPYGEAKTAVAFIERALELSARRVAAIVNSHFLYSEARYDHFTRKWPCARVYHLSSRPSMPPGGLGIKDTGGRYDYVWIVFDKDFTGEPVTRWLRRGRGHE